ncbi:MAG: HK97 gp10 family phage protein [Rhizobiales bacterium]|nr:HK97 gp10 family phage protein [Hyphomicrobiales bacterium]
MTLKLSRWDRLQTNVDAACDRGVFQAATMVADLAAQLAPVDTGELRDSGSVHPSAPNGTSTYDVRFTADHARFVEYGTTDPSYPAQPFLGPAVRAIDIKRAIRDALKPFLV